MAKTGESYKVQIFRGSTKVVEVKANSLKQLGQDLKQYVNIRKTGNQVCVSLKKNGLK